jgi:RNA polymerase primary sigma factor
VAASPKAKPLRMKVSRAKERALMREFGLDETTLTEEEVAKRRQELKTLIKMGKTRGFLTHQEINDHLPEKLVNEEILEAIVSMLNDMGIAVYEQAPDAATLLISGQAPPHRHRRRGRGSRRSRAVHRRLRVRPHHRPGAHVHARDGHGGTAHARRRDRDRQAHRRRPAGHDAGHQRLADHHRRDPGLWPTRSRAGEMQISEVVDGFVSDDEADDYVAEEDFDEFDEEDDDDGQGGSKALTKKLEELKKQALEKFDRMLRSHFDKMRKAYEKEGYKSPAYNKAQHAISEDLMTIRFTVKTIEKLCDILRSQVDDVRRYEREIRKIVVDKCGMPQEHFIKTFPPNVLNLKWAEKESPPASPTAPCWRATCPPMQELQQKLIDLQAGGGAAGRPQEINKR